MTTRFSISELAEMLHVPVSYIRQAVDALASDLTGESFVFQDRNWRIGPSDVKRIQEWIIEHQDDLAEATQPRARRVRSRRVATPDQEA
ncbi:hypothetical protein C7445_10483 [Alicyclobacillus sacchari]|uniref:Uncharacterized protein n=1 Tax=Alicyclobacillus sacchari TaxID=392010 RepID=A0A4R8LR64_9BACL|nr:hypothetical protein [Alicyclobacillus sacchari]TDY49572.1 hypothetical protein C7445_10483 [Alicyclobacillus sacchari]GMA58562.1 hypothetical protein GCM10025858_30650 [Alicyclobacillus sacchari]